MSVRLLVGDAAGDTGPALGGGGEDPLRPAGITYLQCRRRRYEEQGRPLEEARRRLDEVRRRLGGLCVTCKVEPPPRTTGGGGARLLTAHFLVAREVVADCRAAFLSLRESRDLVLTGPWPPFNFVE
jgi:hypothetical protein